METLKSKNVSIVLTRKVNESNRANSRGRRRAVFTGRYKKCNDGRHCPASGMSRKTIYQFFKDKNELVMALVKKKLQEDEDQMSEIIPANRQCD